MLATHETSDLETAMKQWIKKLLFPGAPRVRRIPVGLARGISMRLDMQSQLQRFMGLDERELSGHVRRGLARARSAVDVGANDGH